MKLISWNVNGLRACLGKGFGDYFTAQDADFFCLQETKMQPGQAQIPAEGYHEYFYSAEKKGYSGTAILAKREPLSVAYGMGSELHDHEGRLITFSDVPDAAGRAQARDRLRRYERRPQGDRPQEPEDQREQRRLHPAGARRDDEAAGERLCRQRANNAGWRIDYFLVSERIKDRVTAARIDSDVMGSDHCPVVLEIDL